MTATDYQAQYGKKAGNPAPGKRTPTARHNPVTAPPASLLRQETPASAAPGCQVGAGEPEAVKFHEAGRLHQQQLPGRFRFVLTGPIELAADTRAAVLGVLNQLPK